MTKKPTPARTAAEPPEKLNESITRALEAASVAADSAEEAAGVSEAAEKALAAAAAAQRRVAALAMGTLVSAVAVGGVGAMVYLRSLADLRQGAEIQAAANKVAIEQIHDMAEMLVRAGEAVARAETANAEIAARIDGLGDRLASDLARAIETAGQMQPQMAVAIQKGIEEDLSQTRGAVLAALAEMELGVPGAPGDPDLRGLLVEVRDLLKAGGSARTAAQTAPKAPAKGSQTTKAAAQAKPRPRPQDPFVGGAAGRSDFSYP